MKSRKRKEDDCRKFIGEIPTIEVGSDARFISRLVFLKNASEYTGQKGLSVFLNYDISSHPPFHT
jgi:hypothetical protein